MAFRDALVRGIHRLVRVVHHLLGVAAHFCRPCRERRTTLIDFTGKGSGLGRRLGADRLGLCPGISHKGGGIGLGLGDHPVSVFLGDGDGVDHRLLAALDILHGPDHVVPQTQLAEGLVMFEARVLDRLEACREMLAASDDGCEVFVRVLRDLGRS